MQTAGRLYGDGRPRRTTRKRVEAVQARRAEVGIVINPRLDSRPECVAATIPPQVFLNLIQITEKLCQPTARRINGFVETVGEF